MYKCHGCDETGNIFIVPHDVIYCLDCYDDMYLKNRPPDLKIKVLWDEDKKYYEVDFKTVKQNTFNFETEIPGVTWKEVILVCLAMIFLVSLVTLLLLLIL